MTDEEELSRIVTCHERGVDEALAEPTARHTRSIDGLIESLDQLREQRGKHTRVPWRYLDDAAQAIAEVKAEGYRVYALELTSDAVPYHTVEWPDNVCLVVGHEDHGVTRATLALCDEAVFLPMWGKGASLNVHVALGIVVYHIRMQGVVDGLTSSE